MSTTSCPRCSAQVTLPVGVSNDTTVRCPLCHAHYTLADALVNMPPLLEVVENAGDAQPADWYDEPAQDTPGKPLAMAELPDDDSESDSMEGIESSEAETLELGSLDLGGLELDADDVEIEGGLDSLGEELNSEQEEAPLAAFDSLTEEPSEEPSAESDGADLLDFEAPEATPVEEPAASEDEDALNLESDDEVALDFGGDALSAEDAAAETMEFKPGLFDDTADSPAADADDELKFDLDSAAEEPELGAGATLDFGATVSDETPDFSSGPDFTAGEEEVKFDFEDASDPSAETVQFGSALDDDQVTFDLDAADSGANAGDGLREFDDLHVDASGDAEDIPLDLPEATAAMPVTEEADVAPGKKGKKEKKKKEKKPKAVRDAGDKPRRSLVGILVGMILAVITAMYGMLWLGPAYDFVGLSGYLPGMVLPAEYSKKPQLAYVPPTPVEPLPPGDMAPPVEEMPAEAPLEDVASNEAEPNDAATEHSAARPFDDSQAEPAGDAMPEGDMPADAASDDSPPAEEAPSLSEPSSASEPSAEDDLFAPAPESAVAETDAPEAAMPAEPPAPASATAPDDSDPFGSSDTSPAEDPFAPAADSPADSMPAEEPAKEPAAEDDLFAPAAESASGEPAAEMPSADPFGPATEPATEEAPAEDDLFAPAEAPEMPADEAAPAEETMPEAADPFAPAPADEADATPAEDDLFAPSPSELPADTRTPVPAEALAEDDLFGPAPEDAPAPEAMPEAMPEDDDSAGPASDPFGPAEEPAAEHLPSPVAPTEPELSTPELPPAAPPLPTDELGPRDVPEVSPAEVSSAMQATFVAGQQLMAVEATGNESQLRKARAAFYVNLFGMADAITSAQLGDNAEAVNSQLQAMGPVLKQQLASDPKRLDALEVFGARWLGFPKRTTNGVVVSGKVESTEQVGTLYHTKARMGDAADAPLVTIVTAEKPEVASGDVILSLGSIVEDPQHNIAGYEGSEPSVVWSGVTMKIAP